MRSLIMLFVALLALSPGLAQARLWTSKNGNFQMEGQEITYSKDMVVLRRPSGELVAVRLAELSEDDVKYVAAKMKEDEGKEDKSADEMQTWTGNDGMKVRGRVLAFGRKELVVQRKVGKVYIDGEQFSLIDQLHQRLILKIISHIEKKELNNERQLTEWSKSIGGEPKSYTLEGVLLQLESGDEIGVPFFMFSRDDLAVLEPGWKVWLEQKESDEARERESFLMRSQAMEYQRDRQQYQQIEMLKLDLLAAASGAVRLWEVGVAPGPGNYGRPMTVIVPARDSASAANVARQRYPGIIVGGVRAISNRRW